MVGLVSVRSVLTVLTTSLIAFSFASATQKEGVLHTFHGVPDGGTPSVRVLADGHGGLYGTSVAGGAFNQGCVFHLLPGSDGTWTETVLYSFSGPDGNSPDSSLILDSAGNLYGTTAGGGAYSGGVAFELTPSSTLPWTETALHNFGNGTDGSDPQSELVFDSVGNLYGSTQFGGASGGFENGGTVYRLSPGSAGWTETVLYSFPLSYSGPDGDLPAGTVVIDRAGNLYGVTQAGGFYGYGTVYELTPSSDGTYKERIIHSFNLTSGSLPDATLVFDTAGNLYGTTMFGGDQSLCQPSGCGTVFRLQRNPDKTWSETVLRALKKEDGWCAVGPVAFDSTGNLYAAAQCGGAAAWGSVFELMPSATVPWSERVVHSFTNDPDGASPYAGVIVDASGHLFGTTIKGGSANSGTVFEIAP
jgi:uncharacterized repeat protein (TIGR03803 family)